MKHCWMVGWKWLILYCVNFASVFKNQWDNPCSEESQRRPTLWKARTHTSTLFWLFIIITLFWLCLIIIWVKNYPKSSGSKPFYFANNLWVRNSDRTQQGLVVSAPLCPGTQLRRLKKSEHLPEASLFTYRAPRLESFVAWAQRGARAHLHWTSPHGLGFLRAWQPQSPGKPGRSTMGTSNPPCGQIASLPPYSIGWGSHKATHLQGREHRPYLSVGGMSEHLAMCVEISMPITRVLDNLCPSI